MDEGEAGRTLTVELLSREVSVPVTPLEAGRSLHTGASLRRYRAEFTARSETAEALSDQLTQAREADSALSGTDGRWRVETHSHSYTQGSSTHSFSVEFEELEDPPQAEALSFLDLDLTPLSYQEEVDSDGCLLISAIVEPFTNIETELEERVVNYQSGGEPRYFDLLRSGVSDSPLSVRFGRCLWERSSDGRRHLLRFVSRSGDEDRGQVFKNFLRPELDVIRRKAVRTEATLDLLLERIDEGGELSSEAVEQIRMQSRTRAKGKARDFDEVHDLDSYF